LKNVGAIIQARTSSTRLPGKVLKELPYGGGVTCLEQVIRRLKQCRKLDEIIIATTTEKTDDVIIDIVKKEDVKYFRGSEKNVLARYYKAAIEYDLDVIVRVTSDCPCIDSKIVDEVVSSHLKLHKVYIDYTSNNLIRTYPCGLDVEVFDFDILKKAFIMAKSDYDKEHVVPFIHNHPEKFRLNFVIRTPKALCAPDIRITLDTKEDYILLCAVYDYLYPKNQYFDAKDIINLFKEKPWLKLINKKSMEKYGKWKKK